MKIPAPDNRPPVAITLKLDAATYDLVQLYREFRKEGGEHFTSDSQLIGVVSRMFFEKGDNVFTRWRKTHPLKAATLAPVKVEKKVKKANGVDLMPGTTPSSFST